MKPMKSYALLRQNRLSVWGVGTRISPRPRMMRSELCWTRTGRRSGKASRETTMLRQKETLPLKSAREAASPLEGEHGQYQALLESIGDAEIVLLGEASHGTHEFYQTRAEITRRLIEERGFTAVAVEGDWPDCYRVNRYVRGLGTDPDADAALGDFQRFPLWMWRNTVVKQFVQWLRQHNKGLPYSAQTGFYGLDMYSLYGSVAAVIQYLQQVDPEAADEARQRYACFDH